MNKKPPLETRLLRTFVEVVRMGSVTAAADELNRSQPAISHRLRAIEERFDVALFEKLGRTLELTEYGERLFELGLDVLNRLEEIDDRVIGSAEAVRGTVAVGTFPTVARHLLVDPIEKLVTEHEKLRLNFQFGVASSQLEWLRTGRVEMVVFVGDADPTGLDVEPLGHTGLVAAMAPSEAPDDREVGLRDLQQLRYLAWSGPSDPTFDAAYSYAARHELLGSHTPQIPHIETLRALAARGVGFTILPDYTTLRDVDTGRLVTFSLPEFDEIVPISLLTRTRQVTGPALGRVREVISSEVSQILAG